MTRLLDKARRSLGSAVLLLDTEDFDGAVNRADYTDYGDGVQERSEAELAVSQAVEFLAACHHLIDTTPLDTP